MFTSIQVLHKRVDHQITFSSYHLTIIFLRLTNHPHFHAKRENKGPNMQLGPRRHKPSRALTAVKSQILISINSTIESSAVNHFKTKVIHLTLIFQLVTLFLNEMNMKKSQFLLMG